MYQAEDGRITEANPAAGKIREEGMELEAILLTHAHLDHVGGLDPATPDAGNAGSGWALDTATGAFSGSGSGKAHAFAPVTVGASDVTGVDFGFNFDTVVNTNDRDQGSLRQFLLNANALAVTGLEQEGLTAGEEVTLEQRSMRRETKSFEEILEDVELARAQGLDQLLGAVEADELHLAGPARVLESPEHAEGGGLVGTEHAVDVREQGLDSSRQAEAYDVTDRLRFRQRKLLIGNRIPHTGYDMRLRIDDRAIPVKDYQIVSLVH